MAPKPRLIPFQPLCRPLEYLTANELSKRMGVDRNAIRRTEARIGKGTVMTSQDIRPSQDSSGRTINPYLNELASRATNLPFEQWEGLWR